MHMSLNRVLQRASLLLALSSSLGVFAADTEFSVLTRFTLDGAGKWDYTAVEPGSHRLFVSRGDHLQVIDDEDGHVLGEIGGTDGVHGVAFDASRRRAYSSNGRADSVSMIDLDRLASIATIKVTGNNPDSIVFEPASARVVTFNGRSSDATVIDGKAEAVVATVKLENKPEFAVADDKGRVFVNIESEAGAMQRVDLSVSGEAHVGARWSLDGCSSPSGLAIDIAHGRLFSVCSNRVAVVTDASTGRLVATVSIGAGPDAAVFDARHQDFFSSNGRDGTLTIVHEDDPDHYSIVQTLRTAPGARTMALDAQSSRIFLPTVIDGHFTVIVVAPNP